MLFRSVSQSRYSEVPDYLEEISLRRRGEDFTPEAAPAPVDAREVGINLLANDIVPRNAAFRDQTVNDIRGAIRDEILPIIERLDPNNEADRRTLERELRFLETNPFDRDLGQRLETYIQNNSARENDIRGRVVDFMTDKIQRRLDQAPAPIETPEEQPQAGVVVPQHIRGSITREMNELMMLGQLEQTGEILNRIFNREGEFRPLTDEQLAVTADFTNSLLRQLINDPNYRPAAPQLPAPVVNPIDELERRYGQERAPIDIVTDGLNLPIPQFQRVYCIDLMQYKLTHHKSLQC